MRYLLFRFACIRAVQQQQQWRGLRCSCTAPVAATEGKDPQHALRRVEFSQDRIARDGSLTLGSEAPAQGPAARQDSRPAYLPSTAPAMPPISEAQLQTLVDVVANSSLLVVLTGAGCSTESAIPDYRGPEGAYRTGFKPMTHQQFMALEASRRRYWARSFAGWHEFSGVQPNAAHDAIARLQSGGWVASLITQNVDRLHSKAGATDVLELHGTTHRVVCMGCGRTSPRQPFQDLLAELNPGAAEAVRRMQRAGHDAEAARRRALRVGAGERDTGQQRGRRLFERRPDGDVEVPVRRPDGDVELQDAGQGFVVPPCPDCGGVLKPDVTFFGDAIPAGRSSRALALAEGCDAMLVVGSSLAVYSAYRLAKAAKRAGAALCVLTAGPTRADDMADAKVEALAGEALARLAAHPSLLVAKLP